MINLINQLYAFGYAAPQILKYLSAQLPNLTQGINTAMKAGYSADKILKYISNKIPHNEKQVDEKLNSNEKYMRDNGFLSQDERNAKTAKYLKTALGVGAGILATAPYAAKAYGMLSQGTPPHASAPNAPIPSSPAPQPNPAAIQNNPPIATGMTQINQPTPTPLNQPQGATQTPNITQTVTNTPVAPVAQPNPPVTEAEKVLVAAEQETQSLWNMAKSGKLKGGGPADEFLKASNKLIKSGDIQDYDTFKQFRKWWKASEGKGRGKPFSEFELFRTETAPWREPSKDQISNTSKPIDKGSLVLTPQGKVSEIKGKDKTGAIIEDGGKGVKVPESELEREPEDIPHIVEKILKIPEVDRSSVVSLFTYDPEERNMYIQYHNGETYKYYDVDPEEVREVAEKSGIPVTSGKNMFGAWSPEDKKSLGATLIKRFLQNPKYKKPGIGQPENPNYKKLDTLYDYWEKLRKKPKRKKP